MVAVKKHSMSPSCGLTIPLPDNTALILIDMQEKLVAAMPQSIRSTIDRQKILLHSFKLLLSNVIITEQYPKGLGATIAELSSAFSASWPVFEKTSFSCMGSADVRKALASKNINTVVLAGVETHVCVLQTALDCVSSGFQTLILTDAVNSRREQDMLTALNTAPMSGVFTLTVESLVFMLMRDSSHPAFRDISRLMR